MLVSFAEAWNFGPSEGDAKTVTWIINKLIANNPNANWKADQQPQLHEANYLKLDSSKARTQLGWKPRWDLDIALSKIMDWHQNWHAKNDMEKFSLIQIAEYQAAIEG